VHLTFEPQNSSQFAMVIFDVHMKLIFFNLYYHPDLSNLTKFGAQSFTHSCIQDTRIHEYIKIPYIRTYIYAFRHTYIRAYIIHIYTFYTISLRNFVVPTPSVW